LCRRRGSPAARGLGNYVILAGQVGVAGHLKIGNRVSVGAQSGVMHNIPDGEKWLWTPALPDRQAKRLIVASLQVPDLTAPNSRTGEKTRATTEATAAHED
jgi:UDP-3-O-[3-hydroxymyristoyl] glucosamine N-acyltransferase